MIKRLKLKPTTNSDFEKIFSNLAKMGNTIQSAKNTFELLRELNPETTDLQCDILVSEIHKIQYQSNTNSYFYFYFPIISHILYCKPQYEKELLKYLISPNFANGTSQVNEMILIIKEAIKFKLNENEFYLTRESQFWVEDELYKLEKEIQREIDICQKELDE
ncbi:hypothetical protein BXU01_06285 [[Flexibacter] sp. ATCC 35103]|nr:hypothetical protein BXU01_06285 [[Flexibacter] sp. ATCC 35103]